jgi:hypothetical protein
MIRTLSWIPRGAGYYVEPVSRYQIREDNGTWVLSSGRSVVRHFRTLKQAQDAAQQQEATGDHGGVDWTAMSKGQVLRDERGWVILCRPNYGVWREVAGPFNTRRLAREALKLARR